MLIKIILWIALWRWRSWNALASFSVALAAIQLFFGYVSVSAMPQTEGWPWYAVLAATSVDVALSVAIFATVGAAIVWFRGGKVEKRVSEAEIDAELARVRAEAKAREQARE